MSSSLLCTNDLRAITGYKNAADVARCLRRQGVKVFEGKDGPWTTIEAINSAAGVSNQAVNDSYKPDEII